MTLNDTLPDGWTWTTLGKLGNYINGHAFKPSDWGTTGRPIIRIQNLTGSTNTLNRYFGDVEEKYIIRDGDLLISWSATLGVFIYHGEEAVLNQHIFKVETYGNKKFLYYLVMAFLDTLKRQVHGSGMQHITKGRFDDSPVPLPPPPEQERIVERIESLFTQLDAGVAGLKRVQAALKRYKASVLKAAVEGRLVPQDPTDEPAEFLLKRILAEREGKISILNGNLPVLPKGWSWASIEQLAYVGTGATPLRSKREYYDQGIIPWVTSGALNSLFIDRADEYITHVALQETNAKIFPSGTLLVAMYGEGKTRGKVSELRIDASSNQACAGLVFKGKSVRCKPYVKLFLLKNYEDIRRLSSGGVQPNLNLSIIKTTLLPLPPLEEQQRIVAEVERRLSVVQELEGAVSASLKRAGRLRQAILKQAFEGRLIEPAAV